MYISFFPALSFCLIVIQGTTTCHSGSDCVFWANPISAFDNSSHKKNAINGGASTAGSLVQTVDCYHLILLKMSMSFVLGYNNISAPFFKFMCFLGFLFFFIYFLFFYLTLDILDLSIWVKYQDYYAWKFLLMLLLWKPALCSALLFSGWCIWYTIYLLELAITILIVLSIY